MRLTRYFFASRDLDDLERLEEELEQAGILTPQIHVLTLDDSGVDEHTHLHAVSSLMKKDIIHSTIIGAVIGVGAAALALLVPWLFGWTSSPAGWIPWIFLAVIALGFCTWEGGLWGIQTPNVHFEAFAQRMRDGEHVFFVDAEPARREMIDDIARRHSGLTRIGTGHAAPSWIVFGQHRFKKLLVDTLP
jgi:hypothetical protein